MFNELGKYELIAISPCVKDDRLRSISIAVKLLFFQTQTLEEMNAYAEPTNFYRFSTQGEWLQIRLVVYFVQLDEVRYSSAALEWETALSLDLTLAITLRHSKFQEQPKR